MLEWVRVLLYNLRESCYLNKDIHYITMNSQTRQAKLQELVELLRAKLQEIKRAKERDAIFEERKKLYLELKDLNQQLTDVINQVDYSSS